MKKKVISEVALKALFAEDGENLTAEELEAKALEAKDLEAKELEAKELEAKELEAKDLEAKELEDKKPKAKEDENLAELVQAEFDDYKAAKDQEIVDLQASLDASEAKYATDLKEFKEIVVGQIAKMRTALSVAAVDMTEWSVEAVITEYNSTKDSFVKALPVGSVIPPTKETKQEAAVRTNLDASSLKALGIK